MLRNYQHQIRQQLFYTWNSYKNIIVQMPTGTGKTHLLASIVSSELNGGSKGVWIVAHRRELVEQIKETVERYGISKEDGRVKVMSIQWLSLHWEDMKAERPSLIVIDEAHHALAETYKELWTRYPDAKKLGMTATPCRLNRKGFTDLFEILITSDNIADFIRQGWLSPFDYVSIRPDSEDQRLVDSLSKRGADGDFQVKEMNSVLNRRPTIERLYESVRQYADEKKGIVYAVSISHARNIAAYYNEHGMNAVAIDSKTPTKQRKQFVEDFRQGKIQVLVNVDVFSEGFDCPDVEFVQMARPTLSLAKYLQQVGRGLRKTEGKESCMLIDNVGLYRLFGLPTAERDWQAMFEGRLAGKGYPTSTNKATYMAAMQAKEETLDTGGQLETIVSHGQLLEYLQNGISLPENNNGRHEELKPFKDRQSGLWGLRQGQTITAMAQYRMVFDVKDDLAAVKFKDYRTGIVDGSGNIRMKLDKYRRIRFMADDIVSVEDNANRTFHIDLKTDVLYNDKPKVLKFGRIEIVKSGILYYSRTKHVYKSHAGMSEYDIIPRGFYVRIYDCFTNNNYKLKHVDGTRNFLFPDCVCILENDDDEYYRLSGELADGSIVIADGKGNYYHATEGREKQYIACDNPKTEDEDFDKVVPRLLADAERRASKIQEHYRKEKEQKRQERLESVRSAEPFQSGMKWGLRLGDKVIVPPIYRNIQTPVGNYCAVEAYPHQWGVIMLDGKVVIEARYMNVEIKDNGTAILTLISGNTRTVRLKEYRTSDMKRVKMTESLQEARKNK